MKTIQGDLVLEDNSAFHESLEVKGNILGKDGKRFSLTVFGDIITRNIDAWHINAMNITAWNINARNITAWDIYAWNIYARNINASDINAWDINALDINAWNITAMDINADDITSRNIDALDINASDINAWNIKCESRKKKNENDKTITGGFITNRSKLEPKDRGLQHG
jgi:hypothetical protein